MSELDERALTALLSRAGARCPALDAALEAGSDLAEHVAGCEACSMDPVLEQLVFGPVDAGDLASVVARLEVLHTPRSAMRLGWRPLALAAAALLMLGVGLRPISVPLPDPGTSTVVRSATIALQGPTGGVAVPERFRWAPVDGADRYLLTVVRPDGTVVWSTEVHHPESPVGFEVLPGARYRWRVEASGSQGVLAVSPWGDFTVMP